MITLETKVEDIVTIPGITSFCIQKGVSLITCSDVFPDTIGNLLKIKKFPDPATFIKELNTYLRGLTRTENKWGRDSADEEVT